jgi:plasmid stabilization system protein ParE
VRALLHPEAAVEAADAAAWYEERNPGMGRSFLGELDKGIAVVAESPETWPVWPGTRPGAGIRRFLLARFPFGIAYAVRGGGIFVVAVPHLSRRPGYFHARVE